MKVALTVLKVIVAAFAVIYLLDYLAIRFQFPNHRQTLGTVQIDVYYAVRLKGSKTEFTRADSETSTCTYSLLPQIGYLPCWYVSRHRLKWIEIGQGRVPRLPAQGAKPLTKASASLPRGCCDALPPVARG